MCAVVQTGYGRPRDVLHEQRVAIPTLPPDRLLVAVHAAGVDRGVWHITVGEPRAARLAFGLRRPRTRPGFDFSGTIVATGSKVDGFSLGDEVFGTTRGSFGAYALVDPRKCAPKPPAQPFAAAGALAVSGLTALHAVRNHGRVRAGQRVLVVGASGGVGSFAVQIAKHFGATVTAIASAAKLEFVRSLGADVVVDYESSSIADHGRHDVIIDIGGCRRRSELRRALVPGGTIVFVGGERGERWLGVRRQIGAALCSPFSRNRYVMFVSSENATDMRVLAYLVTAGEIRTAVDRVHPLANVVDALERLERGEVRGKDVIEVTGSTPGEPAAHD